MKIKLNIELKENSKIIANKSNFRIFSKKKIAYIFKLENNNSKINKKMTI